MIKKKKPCKSLIYRTFWKGARWDSNPRHSEPQAELRMSHDTVLSLVTFSCFPILIALFQIPQYHYFYRTVIAVVEVAAPVYFSSIVKTAFLHHPSGCRIINEEVTPNGIIAFLPEAIINQQTQGFSTDSLVPIGLSKPITGFHIVLAKYLSWFHISHKVQKNPHLIIISEEIFFS